MSLKYNIADIILFRAYGKRNEMPEVNIVMGEIVEFDDHVDNLRVKSSSFLNTSNTQWIHIDDVVQKITVKQKMVFNIHKLYNEQNNSL